MEILCVWGGERSPQEVEPHPSPTPGRGGALPPARPPRGVSKLCLDLSPFFWSQGTPSSQPRLPIHQLCWPSAPRRVCSPISPFFCSAGAWVRTPGQFTYGQQVAIKTRCPAWPGVGVLGFGTQGGGATPGREACVGGGTARSAQRADKRQAVPATSCPALNAARSSPTRREPSGSAHPGAGTRDQGPGRRTSVHTRGPSPSARVRTPAPRGEVSRQPLAFGSIQGGRWGQRAGQGSAPGVGRSREKRLGPRCEVCGSVSHLPEEGFTWNKPQPLELPGSHPSASSQL